MSFFLLNCDNFWAINSLFPDFLSFFPHFWSPRPKRYSGYSAIGLPLITLFSACPLESVITKFYYKTKKLITYSNRASWGICWLNIVLIKSEAIFFATFRASLFWDWRSPPMASTFQKTDPYGPSPSSPLDESIDVGSTGEK